MNLLPTHSAKQCTRDIMNDGTLVAIGSGAAVLVVATKTLARHGSQGSRGEGESTPTEEHPRSAMCSANRRAGQHCALL